MYNLTPSMNLFHRDLGGGGLPPLVVLHGLLGSSRNWQAAGRDLSAGFHVLAPDLRNHGSSPHSGTMTYEAMAGDVLDWMEAQGLGRAAMLGHSMGGKVAMLLACRHPGRVERLVVVDIAPKDYFWPERRVELAALRDIDLGTLASRAEAERLIEARVPDWGLRKFLLTNLDRGEGGGWRWLANLPVLTGALGSLERNPLGEGDRFPGPSLFIAGGGSPYVLPGDHAAIVHHFPEAAIRTIPGAGHNLHMEARHELVGLVRSTFST
jgi:pimeloyl-ACP methyl ester carboxylesterase